MTDVTSRPQADVQPAAPSLLVERRPADGRDTDFVRDLFADSRDELLLLTPDTRDLVIDMQFRAQRRAWRLDHPSARHEILLARGVRAGHLLVDEDGTDVHVLDLVIRSGLRGLGIGKQVVGELLAEGDGSGRTVRLRVWSGNHGARRFFQHCGFSVSGVVGGYHELFRPAAG